MVYKGEEVVSEAYKVLPNIRIQKIVLEDFKSVHYGEVVFNCGRKHVPRNTESDILGIYGQNGSGKTAVIEALSILKYAMGGNKVPDEYSECIAKNADFSKLTFTFDLQYAGEEEKKTIEYSFKIQAIENEQKIIKIGSQEFPNYPTKIKIFDEVLSAAGHFEGTVIKKQPILTTVGSSYPIGPVRKLRYFVGDKKEEATVDIKVNLRSAEKESRSFIFMEETADLFLQLAGFTEYVKTVFEMGTYANVFLFSIDTIRSGLGADVLIPFNTRFGFFYFKVLGTTVFSLEKAEAIHNFVSSINTVLPTIIPEMQLVLKENDVTKDGEPAKELALYANRNGTVLPLRNESSGIIKLVSVLLLVIAAYNDSYVTIAIDELDAGIYEYLLGEILIGLETYGKGQFIFTSHNLRPLELLKKENIIFTTSNPSNRFIRLKGVGQSNNLRNLYLREILSNDQDEQIYDAERRQRMISAFIKAGDDFGEED